MDPQRKPSVEHQSTWLLRCGVVVLAECVQLEVCFASPRCLKTMIMVVLWTGGEWVWSCMR